MLLTGGEIVVQALKKEGVDTVFGYPGGAALPMYDALYGSDIRHILTRHEQGAVHAADGYARATGKVGVCFSTSGPGATNLITGIATANMDSIPLVCITCQVASSLLGKDSFQEADVSGITTPITKHNYMVTDVNILTKVLSEAFYIARSGRPGPVVIDIPKDIFSQTAEFEYPEKVQMKSYCPVEEGDPAAVEEVAKALAEAKRPLLFVGGGVVLSDMEEAFAQILHKTGAPFISSLMGLGSIDKSKPLYLGMVGMHGTYAANLAVTNCDLLIGFGVRFDDRVTGEVSKFAPNAKIAHFEIDSSEINKIVKVDYKVLGDLRWSLPLFNSLVKPCDVDPWIEQVKGWKQEHPLHYTDESPRLKPQKVIEEVCRAMADDAIIVTDVGQHQMWSAHYCRSTRKRGFLTSGGLGTMGYGLPAAIGAKLGCPDNEVWLFSGDGSIMMNCREIATAMEEQLPIKVFILNNHGLGMVRQWQRFFYEGRYSHSKHMAPTDFRRLAEAFDATGITVRERNELDAAIAAAKVCPSPIFVDVWVDDDENVLPMVAPNEALDNLVE